jgi:hypothetical protein
VRVRRDRACKVFVKLFCVCLGWGFGLEMGNGEGSVRRYNFGFWIGVGEEVSVELMGFGEFWK